MRAKIIFSLFSVCATAFMTQAQTNVRGRVLNADKEPIPYITIHAENDVVKSDVNGDFEIYIPKEGRFTLRFSGVGYKRQHLTLTPRRAETKLADIILESSGFAIEEVEVFGERNKQPRGLEAITRMPLKPSDQIQSISIISHKVIEDQGALTLTDALRNIPGVTLFGSYGGVKESLSTRGFRGVPVLKNGVRMDSQFQTASGVVDMQGVESIQMIKGSAAITQGVITDIGNAGGVINVVTKTPQFIQAGQVGVRAGSWGQFRPTFDVQSVLDKNETLGIRMNGAYERADSYRKGIESNRVYFNPSLSWRASDRTLITLEGDYLNANVTPHSSAVNLNSSQGVNALRLMPYGSMLGMNTDNNNTVMRSVMASINHQLTDHLRIRAAYATSLYKVDNLATSTALIRNNPNFDTFTRTVSRNGRYDKNTTIQFDLIAEQLYTGSIKHTAQIGFDYRIADAKTTAYDTRLKSANGADLKRYETQTIDDKEVQVLVNRSVIDTININQSIVNHLSDVLYNDHLGRPQVGQAISFTAKEPVSAVYNTFGILAQDVIEFNKYIKASLGIRYSEISVENLGSTTASRRSAWNPSVGLIISPMEQLNLFGSYTNLTSLRSAANRKRTGEEIGASRTEQFEGGIKSDWLSNRLRFNLTYFHIYTANLSNAEYEAGTNQPTGYYFEAGDLVRDGIEAELNGRVLPNLTVMLGYAYLDARYKNSPSYVEGSAPMNAPSHTSNAWVLYEVDRGHLRNLSLSGGIYYVGQRPVNEYSLTPDGHGNLGGVEPFDMPAYTTINAQVGYKWNRFEARLYMNNLANEIGLNSYFRGGYINQTEPRNFALSLNYKF